MKESKLRLNEDGKGYRVFSAFNNLLMALVILVTAYPLWYVIIASVSDPAAMMGDYGLMWLPKFPMTLEVYKFAMINPLVLSGMRSTLFIVVAGVSVNLVLTCLGAYVMSLRNALFKKPLSILFIFTMYFNGGIIPTYLNVQSFGLMNSWWSVIIPFAINIYNMLILRSAFAAVPDSLIEVARMDGASHARILAQIFLPLSGATLAVMVLYYAVGHWNAWFYASLFIQKPEKYPLQVVLRQIILMNKNASASAAALTDNTNSMMLELVKYALIVISSAPILILYPFLQRFFTKGVMVGAIKG